MVSPHNEKSINGRKFFQKNSAFFFASPNISLSHEYVVVMYKSEDTSTLYSPAREIYRVSFRCAFTSGIRDITINNNFRPDSGKGEREGAEMSL